MILILGGGLAGTLCAYRLLQVNPSLEFLLIEAHSQFSHHHTWSFHLSDSMSFSDQSNDLWHWIRPFLQHTWSEQSFKSSYTRDFQRGYCSLRSFEWAQQMQSFLKDHLAFNQRVQKVVDEGSDVAVTLEDGRCLKASIVLDARGVDPQVSCWEGYQKFVGLDLELTHPHGLKAPVIMDLQCDQKEGYRFFYLLPWSSTEILVEDTRYSLDPTLQISSFRKEILEYVQQKGWKVKKVQRQEQGSLAIPLDPCQFEKCDSARVIPIGIRGGYFHRTTGYSFADAVRVADAVAQAFQTGCQVSDLLTRIHQNLRPLQAELQFQSRFFSLLNRFLFLAAPPQERWKIFHRFYQLPEDLIFRFYAGQLTCKDRWRLLWGRPPVLLRKALKTLLRPKTSYQSQLQNERRVALI